MTEQERVRLEALQKLSNHYELLLSDVISTTHQFDTKRLPSIVQDSIELVVAKSPGFSNVGALTTVNYVLTHVIGQLRPTINDAVYSNDSLCPNYYGILVAKSGGGKDSSYNQMLKACQSGTDLIDQTRMEHEVVRAKKRALYKKKEENPEATIDDIMPEDYRPHMKELVRTVISGQSTRGGTAALLNKLQAQEFGTLSAFMGEFGMELKQGSTVQEILQLLGELYDMGNSTGPEFKTEDVKEAPINGMFPNFLGHTSPKVLFGDPRVREALGTLFHTMLSRRCWFSMPEDDESIENDVVATSPEEAREIGRARRELISTASMSVDTQMAEAIRKMLASDLNRVVTFSDEASLLYEDYFEFSATRSKLMEDSSIPQIEMSGRAFKVGRLAAVWSLAQGSNELTYDNLAAAIYFAEYNQKYLHKFIKLTTAKSFILLGDLFKTGKIDSITLDDAMSNGYIYRVSKEFKDLLDPLNSYLRESGVCTYDETARIFNYVPFHKVKEGEGYSYSYTKVDGMSKDSRKFHLDNFAKEKVNGTFKSVLKLMNTDTIYNVFLYANAENKDGLLVERNRAQANMISNTKLLSIDVDESEVPLNIVHEYLEDYRHIVSTTSNCENKNKFRIVLFTNVEIDGSDPALYAYIVKRVSADLLVKPDPTCFNPAQPMYSYANSDILHNEQGELFDVTEYIADFATNVELEAPRLVKKSKNEGLRKSKVEKITANVNQIFDYVLTATHGNGSFQLARAALHMRDEEFNQEEFKIVINYLNSVWTSPMPDERLERTIIIPYIDQFPGV